MVWRDPEPQLPGGRPHLRRCLASGTRARPVGNRTPGPRGSHQRRTVGHAGRLLPAARLPERHRHDRPGLLALELRRATTRLVEADSATAPACRSPMTTERRSWRIPTALIALSVIPVVAGSLRVVELVGRPGGAPVRRPVRRLAASGLVVHVVGAIVLRRRSERCSSRPASRRRRPGYHRAAGRTLVVAGCARGGLWPLDDVDVLAEGGHGRRALPRAAGVRRGHGGLHRPRVRCHPASGHHPPPGVDDPGVRARAAAQGTQTLHCGLR